MCAQIDSSRGACASKRVTLSRVHAFATEHVYKHSNIVNKRSGRTAQIVRG